MRSEEPGIVLLVLNFGTCSSMMLACWATARSLGPVAFASFELGLRTRLAAGASSPVLLRYYPFFFNYGALLLPVSQWQMIWDTLLAGWVACPAEVVARCVKQGLCLWDPRPGRSTFASPVRPGAGGVEH